MGVVSTSSRRTTKSWSLDSDVRATLSEIFPESDSRSARSPTSPSTPSSGERRKDQGLKRSLKKKYSHLVSEINKTRKMQKKKKKKKSPFVFEKKKKRKKKKKKKKKKK